MVLSRKQANAMAMNNGLANNISSVSSSFSTPENGTETVGRQVKWIRSIYYVPRYVHKYLQIIQDVPYNITFRNYN